jgi:hypothetical protein
MMANMVASAPTGAVLAMRASIGTMLSWASGAAMVGVDDGEGARAQADPLVDAVEEADGRQRQQRSRHGHPEQGEAHRTPGDDLAEHEEAGQAQHRAHLGEDPQELLVEPEAVPPGQSRKDRVAIGRTEFRECAGHGI